MTLLKQNLLYSVSYQILAIILPLITAPYLSRVLGPDKLGEYSFTHSVANYFMLMAMLGIQAHGNRSVAAVKDDLKKRSEIFWHIYAIQAATNLVAICLYCAYVTLWSGASSQIFWLQSFYVISGLLDISWLFFGMEQFKITVSRNACIRAATTALIFLLVKRQEDLWKYTLIFSLSSLFSQLYLWFCLRGRIRRPAHLDRTEAITLYMTSGMK